jgi:hypothetical protein
MTEVNRIQAYATSLNTCFAKPYNSPFPPYSYIVSLSFKKFVQLAYHAVIGIGQYSMATETICRQSVVL